MRQKSDMEEMHRGLRSCLADAPQTSTRGNDVVNRPSFAFVRWWLLLAAARSRSRQAWCSPVEISSSAKSRTVRPPSFLAAKTVRAAVAVREYTNGWQSTGARDAMVFMLMC